MAQAPAATTLRQMLERGSSLSRTFNDARVRLQSVSKRLHSGQDETSSSDTGQSNQGVPALRPRTLEEKMNYLKRQIHEGKLVLAEHASIDDLRQELRRPEHTGIGADDMVKVLMESKLLQKPPRFKIPEAALRMRSMAPQMA
jgi:hypothetical protein